MKCTSCQAATERTSGEVTRNVGDHTFIGLLPVDRCSKCGEELFDGQDLARFELAVAHIVAEEGMVGGASFKFMRKVLGMKATEIAELLDVAAETISRWETDERPVDRASWAALASLVVDRFEGRDRVISILRAMGEERKRPKRIRVDLP